MSGVKEVHFLQLYHRACVQSEWCHATRLSSQCNIMGVGLRQGACIEPKLGKHDYSQGVGGSAGMPKLVFSCVVRSELRE